MLSCKMLQIILPFTFSGKVLKVMINYVFIEMNGFGFVVSTIGFQFSTLLQTDVESKNIIYCNIEFIPFGISFAYFLPNTFQCELPNDLVIPLGIPPPKPRFFDDHILQLYAKVVTDILFH